MEAQELKAARWPMLPMRVEALSDVESLRLVRNELRSFMTRAREIITPEEQAVWWSKAQEHVEAYLFQVPSSMPAVLDPSRNAVGYGLVYSTEWAGKQAYIKSPCGIVAGGLRESWRGQGLGTELFRFLTERAMALYGRCALEVLVSNAPAKRVYRKLGFVPFGRRTSESKVLMMVKK